MVAVGKRVFVGVKVGVIDGVNVEVEVELAVGVNVFVEVGNGV